MTLTVVHWTSRTNTGSEHVATVKNDGNNLAMDYVRTYVLIQVRADGDPCLMICWTLF